MRLPTILACACLAAGAALPASAAALGVPQRNAQTLAAQLVDLTVPSDMIIADAEKAYEANFRTGFLANPRARDAVQRMPGLLDAATNAGVAARQGSVCADAQAQGRYSRFLCEGHDGERT
jgi:hypothetical protein